jgi:acetyl esterase/lipase
VDILSREPLQADHRIAYGDDPSQFGDLRLPTGVLRQAQDERQAGDERVPVVIVVHGGFWRAQWGLEHASHECAALAAEGMATWSLEYRRVGQAGGGWPGTFDDIRNGTAHLEQLAREYPLDLQRVIAIGHSAGGHLALWLATQAAALPFRLRGVISLAGVVDLRRAAELSLGRGAAQELLGGSPEDFPDRYAAASPSEHLPLGIAQALIHGEDDPNVPIELSERYAEAAAQRGDQLVFKRLPHTGHFEVIDPLSHAWPPVLASVLELSRG